MSDAASDSFRRSLEQIADLARRHPDYRFEYIQSYISQLGSEGEVTPWIETLDAQWREMPAPRREACLNMFENALLLARQATYRPVNELDAFLERQLYGVQDEQAVLKGTVSQVLKQLDERRRATNPPSPGTAPMPQGSALPAMPVGRPPAAGRTNPLNPRQIPKGPEDK